MKKKRVEKELKEFITEVEKYSGHQIHYMGHEKRYGKHLIRFLFRNGGFLEVMIDKPLAMNAHFIGDRNAKKFLEGLKKALNQRIPDHPVKKMFIESIKIEDGKKDDLLTLDKWDKLHRLTIHKTIVTTAVVVSIFVIMELTEMFFGETTKRFFHLESAIISIVTAVIIALFFDKIKEKIAEIVSRFL